MKGSVSQSDRYVLITPCTYYHLAMFGGFVLGPSQANDVFDLRIAVREWSVVVASDLKLAPNGG